MDSWIRGFVDKDRDQATMDASGNDDAVLHHESALVYCRIDMTTCITIHTVHQAHIGSWVTNLESLLIAGPARILPYVSRSAT
jgi:hypothetical protein